MPRKKGSKKELVGEPYKLTVKSLDRTFTSEGSTLEEALRKIKISGGARALSVLKVEMGDRVKDNILIKADHTQGLFSEVGPTRKNHAIKQAIERIGL